MVTKEKALVDVLQRLKTREWGYDVKKDRCTYDKNVGGGCAIGKWLPENKHTDQDIGVIELFSQNPEYKSWFEEPDSEFWHRLQDLHDTLARMDVGEYWEDQISRVLRLIVQNLKELGASC